jgi:integrase
VSNYLIKQGQKWSVKVTIPADVKHIFGKQAFKQTLKTSDKTVAIARSGPLIAQFKHSIEEARGNPTQHLDDYLAYTQSQLRDARKDPNVQPAAIDGIEEEALGRLLAAHGVQHTEQLPKKAEAEVVRSYKVVTGQQTLFDGPLGEYVRSRKVEPKTEAKDRHAVSKFASRVSTVEEVDRQAVRDFVSWLSKDEGLKNRTIKDNLSTLRVYWNWLADHNYAREDRANPFENVKLPSENRKAAAEKVRLPFSVEDIQKLHKVIEAGHSDMMRATFMLAIYTGCRIEEITSLETANVTEETIQIVRAKTAAGNRTIPIHPAIKSLAADLRARGDKYLLPDLVANKYGARSPAMSKQFGKVKSRLGYDSKYVFHSLRKTVTTLFEQAGVPESVSADILGHDKKTMTYGVYSGGSSMEQKLEAVLKLKYVFLSESDHLREQQRMSGR